MGAIETNQTKQRLFCGADSSISGIPFQAGRTGTEALAFLAKGPAACPVVTRESRGTEKVWFRVIEGIGGKGCTLLTEAISSLSKMMLTQIPGEYKLPSEFEDKWNEKKASVPFDGERLSIQGIAINADGSVEIQFLPALYSQLAVFRGMLPEEIPDLKTMPNLLTIYGLSETQDGYLVLALRNGKVSDQSDTTCTPAGFIDRPKGPSLRQETVLEAILREGNQEIFAVSEDIERTGDLFDISRSYHLGVAGSNSRVWDVTNLAYLALNCKKDQISLPMKKGVDGDFKGEHQLHIFIPNNLNILRSLIAAGTIEVPNDVEIPFEESAEINGRKIPLAGLVLGALFQYVRSRESRLIAPNIRHDEDAKIEFSTAVALVG